MLITKLLVLPLVLHVLLIVYVGQESVRARIKSVRSGQTKISDIAVSSNAWPSKVKQLGNNFDNQFETPTLWYANVAVVLALGVADFVFVGLAWIYLLLRIAHSLIHIGDNYVPTRMRVFLASFAALVAMWLWLAIRLFVLG